jgi:hypothetical protein
MERSILAVVIFEIWPQARGQIMAVSHGLP